jgi:hypothetical protein
MVDARFLFHNPPARTPMEKSAPPLRRSGQCMDLGTRDEAGAMTAAMNLCSAVLSFILSLW